MSLEIHPALNSPPRQSSANPSRTLRGEYARKFHAFFDERCYTILGLKGEKWSKAHTKTKWKLSLPDTLRSFLFQLKNLGIEVVRVSIKGSASQNLFLENQGPLADIDLSVEIMPPTDWETLSKKKRQAFWEEQVRATLLDSMQKVSNADKECKFVIKNPVVVNDRDTQSALYSLEAEFNGAAQDIDIQIVIKSKHQCLFSCDAVRVDITPLLLKQTDEPMFRTVDGYPLRKSIDLIKQRKFTADPEKIQTLRKVFLSYCKTILKGFSPETLDIERCVWERMLQEYEIKGHSDQEKFTNFFMHLGLYLNDHYLDQPEIQIIYLFNAYVSFLRFSTTPAGIDQTLAALGLNDQKQIISGYFHSMNEADRDAIEKTVVKAIYAVYSLSVPSDLETARAEIELTLAYLYTIGKEHILKGNQAFFKIEQGKYLLAPRPQISAIEKKIKTPPAFALLGTVSKKNPTELQNHFAQWTLEQKKASTMQTAVQSDPLIRYAEMLQEGTLEGKEAAVFFLETLQDSRAGRTNLKIFSRDFRETFKSKLQSLVLERIEESDLVFVNRAMHWMLATDNVNFSLFDDPEFILDVLLRLCEIRKPMAVDLFKIVFQKNIRLDHNQFLTVFIDSIENETDAEQAIQMVALIANTPDAKTLQGHLERLALSILNKVPSHIPNFAEWLHKNVPFSTIQAICSNLYTKGAPYPLLRELHQRNPNFFDGSPLASTYWIQLNDRKEAVNFYPKLPFTQGHFAKLLEHIFTGRLMEEGLVCGELEKLKNQGALDPSGISALACLCRHSFVLRTRMPRVSKMLLEMQGWLGSHLLSDNKDSQQILQFIASEKKKAAAPPTRKSLDRLRQTNLQCDDIETALRFLREPENREALTIPEIQNACFAIVAFLQRNATTPDFAKNFGAWCLQELSSLLSEIRHYPFPDQKPIWNRIFGLIPHHLEYSKQIHRMLDDMKNEARMETVVKIQYLYIQAILNLTEDRTFLSEALMTLRVRILQTMMQDVHAQKIDPSQWNEHFLIVRDILLKIMDQFPKKPVPTSFISSLDTLEAIAHSTPAALDVALLESTTQKLTLFLENYPITQKKPTCLILSVRELLERGKKLKRLEYFQAAEKATMDEELLLEVKVAYAVQLCDQKKQDAAIKKLKEIKKPTPAVFLLLASCQFYLGDYKSALAAAKFAANKEQFNEENWQYLLGVYQKIPDLKLLQEAIEQGKKAVALFPNSIALIPHLVKFYIKANGFNSTSYSSEILRLSAHCLNLDPQNATYWHNTMGSCYIGQSDFKNAEESFKKAAALDPESNILMNLIYARLQNKNDDEAVKNLDQFMQNPVNAAKHEKELIDLDIGGLVLNSTRPEKAATFYQWLADNSLNIKGFSGAQYVEALYARGLYTMSLADKEPNLTEIVQLTEKAAKDFRDLLILVGAEKAWELMKGTYQLSFAKALYANCTRISYLLTKNPDAKDAFFAEQRLIAYLNEVLKMSNSKKGVFWTSLKNLAQERLALLP